MAYPGAIKNFFLGQDGIMKGAERFFGKKFSNLDRDYDVYQDPYGMHLVLDSAPMSDNGLVVCKYVSRIGSKKSVPMLKNNNAYEERFKNIGQRDLCITAGNETISVIIHPEDGWNVKPDGSIQLLNRTGKSIAPINNEEFYEIRSEEDELFIACISKLTTA